MSIDKPKNPAPLASFAINALDAFNILTNREVVDREESKFLERANFGLSTNIITAEPVKYISDNLDYARSGAANALAEKQGRNISWRNKLAVHVSKKREKAGLKFTRY